MSLIHELGTEVSGVQCEMIFNDDDDLMKSTHCLGFGPLDHPH